jgi:hypothetical protein
MRYELYTDIGGFFWWIMVRFCKTKLEDEQSKDNWSRNILFLLLIGMILVYITIKLF